MLIACGGGGASSGVPADKAASALTVDEKTSMCEAYNDYALNTVIGSAERWCRWKAQNEASGLTDADLQSSCAVAYDTCMVDSQANFDALKQSTACGGSDPLSSTLMFRYSSCNTTAGQLEACGREQIEIYGAIRDVPCSQYTVARRTAVNTDAGADSCEAIEPSCPPQ
jgi:hypothetical protein